MAARFTTHIPGTTNDAHNGLWVMWHVKEAVLGRQPLFSLPLLYYPHGASLLTHVPGPLTGFFALPFWPLGPEAAHNGAVLVSFVLTGYSMFLLARGLGLKRPVALFAGLFYLVAPMHLVGLWGHTTKVFLGTLPLALLALHHTLDLRRSRWWAVATAVAVLAAMLHDSLQLVLLGVAAACFIGIAFWYTGREERRRLLDRLLLLAAACAAVAGPLMVATAVAAYDPAIRFNANPESLSFQPDAAEFFLPPAHSLLFGRVTQTALALVHTQQGIETNVALSWAGIGLGLVALWRAPKEARAWLVFTAVCVVLSLGPALKLLGRREFTEYSLPIILPYALLTMVPGLDFLRTPGRFMEIGFAGLAIVAAYGLAWLYGRYPRRAGWVFATAAGLLLAEMWPQPWPLLSLRPVPAFYRHLAADPEPYGVLDLPVTALEEQAAIVYNTHYQLYQMTHRKGIAMGYISRTYGTHPVLPCLIPAPAEPQPDVTINGRPADCRDNALFDLAFADYRYVVWHKPRPEYEDYRPGSWGEAAAASLVQELFGNQEPLMEDGLARVYAVPPLEALGDRPVTMALASNWYGREDEWRWARSPAVLVISAPRDQAVVLEITPGPIYQTGAERGQIVGGRGSLRLRLGDDFETTVTIRSDQVTAVPLRLPAGVHYLSLELEAGSFSPARYGAQDVRQLSFAVRSINLRTP